jgi:ATP-dependent Clp protease ATP-binding subunit ClpC
VDALISAELRAKLVSLGDCLRAKILGQDEALSDIVALLQRSFCNLRYPGRPVASMLFPGPTGVGKTETARIFTQHIFGQQSKLVRLDMSEYTTIDSINILRGRNQGEARIVRSLLRSLIGIRHATI